MSIQVIVYLAVPCSEAMLQAALRTLGGVVYSADDPLHRLYCGRLSHDTQQVWIGQQTDGLDPDDPDHATVLAQLGGPPQAVIQLDCNGAPGSERLALVFCAYWAARGPCSVWVDPGGAGYDAAGIQALARQGAGLWPSDSTPPDDVPRFRRRWRRQKPASRQESLLRNGHAFRRIPAVALPAAWFIPELPPDAWLALLTERLRGHQPRIRPMAFHRQAVGWTFALPLTDGTQALVWLTPEPGRVRLDVWTDGWPERDEVGYAPYAGLLQRVGDYLLDQVFAPDDPGARLVIQTRVEAEAERPDVGDMT